MSEVKPSAKARLLALLKEKKISVQLSPKTKKPVALNRPQSPLSYLQQGIWFVDELYPLLTEFNRPLCIEIKGSLDRNRLERAFNQVIQRHQNLRSYVVPGEELVQHYLDKYVAHIPVVDVPQIDSENELERLCLELAQTKIDLQKVPLFRVTLFRVSKDFHLFMLVFQHLIFDATSAKVFLEELHAFYTNSDSFSPPDLQVQWGDYTHWLKSDPQELVFEDQLKFWKQRLSGDLPYLQLPEKGTKQLGHHPKSKRVYGELSAQKVAELKELAQANNATLFVLFLTVFKLLLHKYSLQKDIIVGTSVMGRNQVLVEPLIGCFINTLAIRTEIHTDIQFTGLLQKVNENLLKAMDHQDIPFELLLDKLNLKDHSNLNPVFRVTFEQRANPIELRDDDVTFKERPFDRQQNHYDLALTVQESHGDWVFYLEYQEHIFQDTIINTMVMHFSNLLDKILLSTEELISHIDMLDPQERETMLYKWNKTSFDYPDHTATLDQLVLRQATKTPDLAAVIVNNQIFTYDELNRQSQNLAISLQQLGIRPNEFVGVCIERSFEMVVALLGVLKSGAAYLPIDTSYPQDRIEYMMTDAKVSAVLTQKKFEDFFKGVSKVILSEDIQDMVVASGVTLDQRIGANDLAFLIYTSGSTGTPKGVMNSHGAIVNSILWHHKNFKMGSSDRVLQIASISFDVSIWELFAPLTCGAAVVLPEPNRETDISYIIDLIKEQQLTYMAPGPSWLSVLIDDPVISECSSLTHLLVGGEELPIDLMKNVLDALDVHLINSYGPTEGTIWQLFWNCDKSLSLPPVPIGRPMGNMQAYILNHDMQPVPVGVIGDLYIGGAGLAKGYLNKPELTALAFVVNPFFEDSDMRIYKTGDLVRYKADGTIVYHGRSDYQIQLRGYRIESSEIEHCLNTHQYVNESIVCAIEDDNRDKYLVGYMTTTKESDHLNVKELQDLLKDSLPHYMIPAAYVFLESFPLNKSGKIDRKKLPKPNLEKSKNYQVPESLLEQKIADIWMEILTVTRIGRQDNFFEMGGDSLKAMRMISRIKRKFSKSVSIRLLFDHPILQDFAATLENAT